MHSPFCLFDSELPYDTKKTSTNTQHSLSLVDIYSLSSLNKLLLVNCFNFPVIRGKAYDAMIPLLITKSCYLRRVPKRGNLVILAVLRQHHALTILRRWCLMFVIRILREVEITAFL